MEPNKPIKVSPLSCVPPSPDPPSNEDGDSEGVDDAQQSVSQPTEYDDDEEPEEEDPDEVDDEDPEEEPEEEEEGDDENGKNMINNNNGIVPDSVSDMESDSETHNDDYTVKPVSVSAKERKDDGDDAVDSKNNKSGGGGSIKPFSRIWSLKDEIGMLQGMIDYKKTYKKEATSNQDDFYNFVKGKLEFSFSKTQVKEKLRRVRGKYTNTLKKAVDGKDPVLSDPHEIRLFQLGKQVWAARIDSNNATTKRNPGAKGNGAAKAKENATATVNGKGNAGAKGNGAAKAKENATAKETSAAVNGKGDAGAKGNATDNCKENATTNESIVVGLRAGETVLNGDDDVKAEKSKRMEVERDYTKLYPNLMAGFENENSLPRVPLIKGFKRWLSRCDSSELEEWDRRWKKVRVAEEEAYLNRIALVAEQSRWFKDEFDSSQ